MSPKFKLLIVFLLAWIAVTVSVWAEPVWRKDPFRIFLQDNVLTLFHDQSKIAEIVSFEFNFVRPDILLVQKSGADSLTLRLLFDEGDGFHSDFPSEIFLTVAHFGNTFHFSAAHQSFNHITIRLKDLDAHYFGLIEKLYPGNARNPDLRGQTVDVDVYAQGERDYSENYASAYSAFYLSSAGYGSFFDTFAKGRYRLGVNGATDIYHQTDALDWYLFYGKTGEEIHAEYFNIIGKPKYLPVWACGPIFWRDQNNGGSQEVLEDIRNFTELRIPLTACWIDRPYSHGANAWSLMDFDEKFADPEKWIRQINQDYGMQFMTWVAPMTFSDRDFPGRFPDERGYFDLTDPGALAEFERRLDANQYSVGVRGHKMDRADENFPLTAKWHDPVTESQSRNKYIYLYSKTMHDFLSNAHGKDQFNFARAAFHRCQPFLSAVWGGDSRSNWIGMAGSQANAIRGAFQGFPVWGQDTGGYLGPGRIDETLYIRWLEWGAWNGMFEIKIDGSGGSGEDRPPWKYSERLQDVFRTVCETRMRLLPYIYSCANTSDQNGVLMKPLAYLYPNDPNTYPIWDEYIFGGAFLVAPVFTEDSNRTIYLPEGRWVDFDDPAQEYSGPTTLSMNVPLEKTPVFVKENSIYVTGDIYRGNSKVWSKNLSGREEVAIHLFPGKAGDSTAFDYVDYFDADREKKMILAYEADKLVFRSDALMSASRIELRGDIKPGKVALNGKSVKFDFDKKRKRTTIRVSKNTPIQLEIVY